MPAKSPPPAPADPAPAPTAPPRPAADECCRGGCDWCVLDEYDAQLERYRRALAEWQARQAS